MNINRARINIDRVKMNIDRARMNVWHLPTGLPRLYRRSPQLQNRPTDPRQDRDLPAGPLQDWGNGPPREQRGGRTATFARGLQYFRYKLTMRVGWGGRGWRWRRAEVEGVQMAPMAGIVKESEPLAHRRRARERVTRVVTRVRRARSSPLGWGRALLARVRSPNKVFLKVVLQKSTPPQIRLLIPDICNSKG